MIRSIVSEMVLEGNQMSYGSSSQQEGDTEHDIDSKHCIQCHYCKQRQVLWAWSYESERHGEINVEG